MHGRRQEIANLKMVDLLANYKNKVFDKVGCRLTNKRIPKRYNELLFLITLRFG